MGSKAKAVWIRQLDAARQAQIAVVVEILGELDYLKAEATELDPSLVADCVIKNVDLNGVIRDLDEADEGDALPFVTTGDEARHVEAAEVEHIPLCPRCGGDMTVRVVKNGPRSGARFYGCLSYPACKGTAAIES